MNIALKIKINYHFQNIWMRISIFQKIYYYQPHSIFLLGAGIYTSFTGLQLRHATARNQLKLDSALASLACPRPRARAAYRYVPGSESRLMSLYPHCPLFASPLRYEAKTAGTRLR